MLRRPPCTCQHADPVCPDYAKLDTRVRPQYARCIDQRPVHRREAFFMAVLGLSSVTVWGLTDAVVRKVDEATLEERLSSSAGRRADTMAARRKILHTAHPATPATLRPT